MHSVHMSHIYLRHRGRLAPSYNYELSPNKPPLENYLWVASHVGQYDTIYHYFEATTTQEL